MKNLLRFRSSFKTTLRQVMLAAACLFAAQHLSAQTIAVGSGTATTSFYPLYNYANYNYSQSIYLASEISAAGGSGPSYISAIKYFYVSDGTPVSAWNQLDVYMANTTQATFSTSTSWVSGLSPVYSGTVNVPAAGQWLTINLSTPFLWDGTSNIVIGVHEKAPGYAYPYTQWQCTTVGLTTDYRSLLFYGPTDPNISALPAAVQYDNIYPNIQFVTYTTTPCAGTPPTGTTTASSASVCPNTQINFDIAGVPLTAGYSYQWQSSTNGTTWTNAGAAQLNTPYSVSSQTVTTYYQCVVTCTASGLSATTTPVIVTQNLPTACYCTPASMTCSNGDKFTSVLFGAINDSPVCNASGYTDNTSAVVSASLTAGQSYTISTVIGASTYSMAYVGAWIDYNQNGVFEQAEYTALGNGTSTTINGSMTVPYTAIGGLTHMRLRLESSYSAITHPSPCSATNMYGEIIDYAIQITPSPLCSGMPVAGNAVSTTSLVCPSDTIVLDLSGNGQVSSVIYQWQSSPNGSTWINMGPQQSTTPYSLSGQTATTYYRCVITCTASAQSATTTPVMVTQNPPTACYCKPSGLFCSNASVSNVVFQSINDSPACPANGVGYLNRIGTAASPTVSANQTYTALVAISTPSPSMYSNVGAWLDFNANGHFETSEYFLLGSTTGTMVTGSITIPYTAVGGNTRMRIELESNNSLSTATQNPCSSSAAAGMAVDYLVNITPAPACTGTPNAGTAIATSTAICTNTPDTLNLSGNGIVTGISYQWQSSPNGSNWSNMGAAQAIVPYTVLTQSVATYYRCVLTCTTSTQSATSTPVMVAQNSPTLCYCVNPPTICSQGDQISTVIFATISNTSACSNNGYANYTTSVPAATVVAGQSYTTTTVLGTTGGENVSIWIDYNHNGTFDSSEYTFLGSSNNTTDTIKGTLTISSSALFGPARMRVRNYRMVQLLNTDACNDPSPPSLVSSVYWGETEDYMVNITPPNCSAVNLPPSEQATASSATVCAGGSLVFDLSTALPTATGFTYQWLSSVSGASFTNVGSASGTSSVSITVPQSAYYMCQVLCNGTPAITSGTVFVTTISPTVTAVASPSVICPGETSTLTATGATSYSWSTAATASTVVVSPVVITTYTVTGTDVNSCSSVTTVSLQVNPATDISGTVTTTSGSVAGRVNLYKYEPFLVKFDSVAFATIQANGSYLFPAVNSATYIVKAVPSASSLQITYAPNVISWQTAIPFTHGCATTSSTNIQVQPYAAIAVGTGSLSGRIVEGVGYVPKSPDGKPMAPGNPIPGVVVKGGKNPGAAIFAQTRTDAAGNYAFTNLPVNSPNGDYFILVDIPGLDTNGTYRRQITATVNSYDSLNFIVDNMYVNPITTTTTSINNIHIEDNHIRVFPNPANAYFTLQYSLLKQSRVKVELMDVVGNSIRHIQPVVSQAQGDYSQQVPIDLLGQGLYFVKIYIDGDEATIKLCITN